VEERSHLTEDIRKPVLPFVCLFSVHHRIHYLFTWSLSYFCCHSLLYTILLFLLISLITFRYPNSSYQYKFGIARSLESIFAAPNIIVLNTVQLFKFFTVAKCRFPTTHHPSPYRRSIPQQHYQLASYPTWKQPPEHQFQSLQQ